MTLDEKIDAATHAAMDQLGLSPEKCPDTADHINEMLFETAVNLGVTGDEDDGGEDA